MGENSNQKQVTFESKLSDGHTLAEQNGSLTGQDLLQKAMASIDTPCITSTSGSVTDVHQSFVMASQAPKCREFTATQHGIGTDACVPTSVSIPRICSSWTTISTVPTTTNDEPEKPASQAPLLKSTDKTTDLATDIATDKTTGMSKDKTTDVTTDIVTDKTTDIVTDIATDVTTDPRGLTPDVRLNTTSTYGNISTVHRKAVSLTVDQLMMGLTKGNIRLASPTATTSDKKELPITEILKMVKRKQPISATTSATGSEVRRREKNTQPELANVSTVRKRRSPRSRARSKDNGETTTQDVGLDVEYTDLASPPEGYICVFLPIKQLSTDKKPILIPTIHVRAQVPSDVQEKSLKEDEAPEESEYCTVCKVNYSPFAGATHSQCYFGKMELRSQPFSKTETAVVRETCKQECETEVLVDVDTDGNSNLELGDDDDDDDDYAPKTKKRKTKSEQKLVRKPGTGESEPHRDSGEKPNKRQKHDHSYTPHNKEKIPVKKNSFSAKSPERKDVPKCSVCDKPYTSYDEHITCSGAKSNSERNQKDGQMRSVEIQRVKRRRRVHRFLKLNFTLNMKITEPPEKEYVGCHLVKDDDDLLEEHFICGEERPPLGLTCYVCSTPFDDDISAYNHYTITKCGPKYISKVLFRAKNRAESRPNNVLAEKGRRDEKTKLGQRLKRNYYNAFREKVVREDGTDKKDHICTACGGSFVKEHYGREHRWRCKVCGDIYVHMKGIQLHYNRSHGKSYCLLCHVLFDSASELQVHMRTHQKRLCDLCGQVLANKHHYNKHMLKQHYIANAEPLHNEIVKTKPQPRGLCEICGKEYSWPFLKTKHMASHLNPKPSKLKKCKEEEEEGELEECTIRKNKSQVYPYRCDVCSRGFQRIFYYNQHLERHAKGLACQKCGLYFSPNVDQQIHLAECLKNICSECGEHCVTKEALKRHKQTHTVTPVREVCQICNREFASKLLLKKHALTHQECQCKVCLKQFASLSKVKKHKCSDKKFLCEICGDKFSSKKMAKQHAKVQHNIDGWVTYTKEQVDVEQPCTASMSPLPGPSHEVSQSPGSGHSSVTAHEVTQALMTLHDLPVSGYNHLPLNIVRDQSDLSLKQPPYPIKLVLGQRSQPPNHPPPGYPGAYYSLL